MAALCLRRFCLVLAAALGWSLCGCGSERLTEFRSELGRFRILLPGSPSTHPEGRLPRGVKLVRLEQASGTYDVAWEDLDLSKPKMTPEERLDHACDSAVARLGGKTLSRKKITLADNYPGRDLVAEGPGGKVIVRDRIYLVERRLYQVVVSGPKWWVQSATSRKVLDSFELVEE
jgi:hypothetical protein